MANSKENKEWEMPKWWNRDRRVTDRDADSRGHTLPVYQEVGSDLFLKVGGERIPASWSQVTEMSLIDTTGRTLRGQPTNDTLQIREGKPVIIQSVVDPSKDRGGQRIRNSSPLPNNGNNRHSKHIPKDNWKPDSGEKS